MDAISSGEGDKADGDGLTEEFGFSELVGCLLYLSVNTRPDIAHCLSIGLSLTTFGRLELLLRGFLSKMEPRISVTIAPLREDNYAV